MSAASAVGAGVSRRQTALAIPLLGIMGGVQTADPTIASTALVESARALQMDAGLQAIAASVSTLMLAATVISTGLLPTGSAGVSHAGEGLTSPLTWAPLASGAALLALFAVVELRGAHPFFPMQLFRNPGFLAPPRFRHVRTHARTHERSCPARSSQKGVKFAQSSRHPANFVRFCEPRGRWRRARPA